MTHSFLILLPTPRSFGVGFYYESKTSLRFKDFDFLGFEKTNLLGISLSSY